MKEKLRTKIRNQNYASGRCTNSRFMKELFIQVSRKDEKMKLSEIYFIGIWDDWLNLNIHNQILFWWYLCLKRLQKTFKILDYIYPKTIWDISSRKYHCSFQGGGGREGCRHCSKRKIRKRVWKGIITRKRFSSFIHMMWMYVHHVIR